MNPAFLSFLLAPLAAVGVGICVMRLFGLRRTR